VFALLEIKALATVTKAVIEAEREDLVIGTPHSHSFL
jgi:hypothetical protein